MSTIHTTPPHTSNPSPPQDGGRRPSWSTPPRSTSVTSVQPSPTTNTRTGGHRLAGSPRMKAMTVAPPRTRQSLPTRTSSSSLAATAPSGRRRSGRRNRHPAGHHRRRDRQPPRPEPRPPAGQHSGRGPCGVRRRRPEHRHRRRRPHQTDRTDRDAHVPRHGRHRTRRADGRGHQPPPETPSRLDRLRGPHREVRHRQPHHLVPLPAGRGPVPLDAGPHGDRRQLRHAYRRRPAPPRRAT